MRASPLPGAVAAALLASTLGIAAAGASSPSSDQGGTPPPPEMPPFRTAAEEPKTSAPGGLQVTTAKSGNEDPDEPRIQELPADIPEASYTGLLPHYLTISGDRLEESWVARAFARLRSCAAYDGAPLSDVEGAAKAPVTPALLREIAAENSALYTLTGPVEVARYDPDGEVITLSSEAAETALTFLMPYNTTPGDCQLSSVTTGTRGLPEAFRVQFEEGIRDVTRFTATPEQARALMSSTPVLRVAFQITGGRLEPFGTEVLGSTDGMSIFTAPLAAELIDANGSVTAEPVTDLAAN